EVLDLLIATGDALRRDENGFMAEAAEQARLNSPYDPGVIQRSYQRLPDHFSRDRAMSLIEGELGDARLLDEWVPFKNRLGGVGGRRMSHQECEKLHRTRFRTGRIRSENIDFHYRQGGFGFARTARGDSRTCCQRLDGIQSGGLRGVSLPLRRSGG